MRRSVGSLVFLFALAQPASAQPPSEAPTPAAMRSRLAVMAAEESDRSTADRAVRSYFLHLNNLGEINCIRQELNKAVAGIGEFPLAEFDRFSRSLRDAYFTGIATRVISRFDTPPPFSECMQERQGYSYTISGVEPLGPDRVRYAVHASNTTPIPERAPHDPSTMDMRSTGTQFRFELIKLGRDWRIAQIEERGSYSSTYVGDWRPQFEGNDLLPRVPFMVPPYPY